MWLLGTILTSFAGTVWFLAFAAGAAIGHTDIWDLVVSLGYWALSFACGYAHVKGYRT